MSLLLLFRAGGGGASAAGGGYDKKRKRILADVDGQTVEFADEAMALQALAKPPQEAPQPIAQARQAGKIAQKAIKRAAQPAQWDDDADIEELLMLA